MSLWLIYGQEMGRRVRLTPEPLVIGRSPKCEIQVDQESVSRNHCRIRFEGGEFLVRDLGSTNGTYVNDDLVHDDGRLRHGDQLKVGRTILKFIVGDNVEVDVELITPVAMETQLRFAIREGGHTVGAGVVTEITE